MADSTSLKSTPRRILLATDLSARCDRALDRAVALAAGWNAQLIILHVFENTRDPAVSQARDSLPSWQRPPDAVIIAKQRIRMGLHADVGDSVAKASVLVEEGDPAEVIERVVAAESCDLIITGIAHERPFSPVPVVVGKTVERLLRCSPVPILIVRNRARTPYEHVLAVTDFSDTSGHALQTALRLFPLQTLHVLHAYEAPYTGLVSDPASYEKGYGELHTDELEIFLGSISIPEEQRRRLKRLVERGRPEQLVREYVRDRNADLVVLGTQGRGAMLEALIGSTAKSILATLPCDALVVRAPRAPAHHQD